MAVTRFCTYVLDGLVFGIEVHRVQEVVRGHSLTRVPHAPPFVRGLLNLRGQVVPAFDLAGRLGLKERTTGEPPTFVVVRSDDGLVALLAEEADDVLEVDERALERPPSSVRGVARELVHSVCKLNEHLLLILEVDRALAPTQAPPVRAAGAVEARNA